MTHLDIASSGLERRAFLKHAAFAAVGVASAGALLGACGTGNGSAADSSGPAGPPSPSNVRGNAVYLNYPGWIGPHNVANFETKYPNATIKQTASGFDSLNGVAQTIAQNPKAYDMLLGDTVIAGQLAAGNFLLPVTQENVPGLSLVEPRYRKLFPYGLPIDNDTIGIGYRKDIVKEPIHSWTDFWALAPKYSNRIVMVGIDRYALGCALIYKGLSANSTDPGDLAQAKQALIDIKPHLLAFKTSNLAQQLLNGTAVMSVGYGYETAAAIQKDPNIGWVFPSEGTVSTIEGILGVAATDVPDVVRAFMDFYIQPANYADFIKATSAPHMTKSVDSLLPAWMSSPLFGIPDNATMIEFVGADGTKLYNETWSAVQAA